MRFQSLSQSLLVVLIGALYLVPASFAPRPSDQELKTVVEALQQEPFAGLMRGLRKFIEAIPGDQIDPSQLELTRLAHELTQSLAKQASGSSPPGTRAPQVILQDLVQAHSKAVQEEQADPTSESLQPFFDGLFGDALSDHSMVDPDQVAKRLKQLEDNLSTAKLENPDIDHHR